MAYYKGHRFLKSLLIILIVVNLIIGLFLVKELYRIYAHNKNNSSKITYPLNRHEYFEVFPKDSNSIIFLGNSLTQYFELAELFQNLKIKNRGIGGDITAGLLNRLTPIISAQPQKIFIEIGINDLALGIPIDTILRNYKKLLDAFKVSCPNTKIYIQSLLPVANATEVKSTYCSPKVNADIKTINEELKQYSLGHGETYIDLHKYFVLNKQINPKYVIEDGVHLTGTAYLLWAKILKPYVDE